MAYPPNVGASPPHTDGGCYSATATGATHALQASPSGYASHGDMAVQYSGRVAYLSRGVAHQTPRPHSPGSGKIPQHDARRACVPHKTPLLTRSPKDTNHLMENVPPKTGVSTPTRTELPHTRARKEPRLRTDECSGNGDYPPRDRSLRRPPDQVSPHHTLGHHGGGSARPRVSTNVLLPDAPARRPEHRHALTLRPDQTGQLRQHHLTGTTIFGTSSRRELKTLAIIVDADTTISKTPRDQMHHAWFEIEAAVDFQIVRRLARRPLHKATDTSLGTQALHLWVALQTVPWHVVLHLIKQESHRYNLRNGHIDLHAHNQLAEHVPSPDEPPLQDHMHSHLQHLSPIPQPGLPPPWVLDDVIYNNTGQAYHYPQPLRTMAHIRGSHADNTTS